jgi:acyl-CoA thioester hydrolase
VKSSPEPYLLLPETYPFRLAIDTQFSDMDAAGIVNNIAIARFYESARARCLLQIFGRHHLAPPPGAYSSVLVEITVRYLAECNFPEPVEVGSVVSRVGTSSYGFRQALFQSGKCVGLCEAAIVCTQHGRSAPLPDEARQRLQSLLIAPPKAP